MAAASLLEKSVKIEQIEDGSAAMPAASQSQLGLSSTRPPSVTIIEQPPASTQAQAQMHLHAAHAGTAAAAADQLLMQRSALAGQLLQVI